MDIEWSSGRVNIQMIFLQSLQSLPPHLSILDDEESVIQITTDKLRQCFVWVRSDLCTDWCRYGDRSAFNSHCVLFYMAVEMTSQVIPKTDDRTAAMTSLTGNRFCDKCDMQALGDECHAIFICPFYGQARNKYLKQCNQSKPASVFRLLALFNNCKDDDLAKLEYVRVLMLSL